MYIRQIARGWKSFCAAVIFCALVTMASRAQTFTTLGTFDLSNGQFPAGPIVQGFDGNFYGTTSEGGNNGTEYGTVFRITPGGTITSLYSFCAQIDCTDGSSPFGGLTLGRNGNLYGTTLGGGAQYKCGTVFMITPTGQLTTLHSFQLSEGCTIYSGLIQASDGNFYGTTYAGGTSSICYSGCGAIFKVTPNGMLTTLYSFCMQSGCLDGSNPMKALMEGSDGNLYGSTGQGGANGQGTLFKISFAGVFTSLHSFDGTDGSSPSAPLVQAARTFNGYGGTFGGGSQNSGTFFSSTTSGSVMTLYNFCSLPNCADGYWPSGITQGTNGIFYGANLIGGSTAESCVQGFSQGCGTLFAITPSGTFRLLHTFCTTKACADGVWPGGGLIQGTDGNFYGTTEEGIGSVFKLSVGLAPFVRTSPLLGATGATVVIYGYNLSGATAVSFHGTPAAYTVVSDTEISATVPSGASTGTVEVTTSSGSLSSNLPFRVLP